MVFRGSSGNPEPRPSIPLGLGIFKASLLCEMRVNVCLCPKTQKANQRPLNLDKQRCEGFGTDRAFAYKIEIGRVIPFESTPNGWNLTVELEAPTDANSKLQEIMDIMMTETRSEQTEKAEHMRGLPHAIILLTGRKDVSSLQLFRLQSCKTT